MIPTSSVLAPSKRELPPLRRKTKHDSEILFNLLHLSPLFLQVV
jgi:hypothetical protein